MKTQKLFFVLMTGLLGFVIVGCGAVAGGGGSPTPVADPQSAAAFLPALDGYTVTGANNLSDAISAAVGEGAAQLDNIVLEQTITRIDNFIQCYEDAGAVAANIYTQADLSNVINGTMPSVGAVAVVNQDRVRENLIACLRGGSDSDSFSAQSAGATCQQSGTFETGGDTFTYVYISTQQEFCIAVEQHFAGIGS